MARGLHPAVVVSLIASMRGSWAALGRRDGVGLLVEGTGEAGEAGEAVEAPTSATCAACRQAQLSGVRARD